MRQELYRQLTHIVFSLVIVGLWVALPRTFFIVFLLLLIVAGIAIVRTDTIVARFLISAMERRRNKYQFPGKGAFLLTVGILLTAILFPAQFIPAILVVGLADAASTLIGKWVGTHNIYATSNKTWEGVIAFFLVTCLVLFWYSAWWPVLAIILTAVESVDVSHLRFVDDNLLLPLITGLLLFI